MQTFTGTIVEPVFDPTEVCDGDAREIRLLRQESPYKPDGVLYSSLLPAVVGSAEVR